MTRPKIRRPTAHPCQPSYYAGRVRFAVLLLRQAKTASREGCAPYLEKRIAAALSSAYGALRNAENRVTREEVRRHG